MSTEMQTPKSWLSRPDGKVGTTVAVIGAAALAVAVVINLNPILSWLILAATNMLTLAGLCAALVAVGVVIFDPRWRNLVFYGYKSLMRAITSAFIELDPIGILKTYINTLQDKLAEMDKSIGNLGGQTDKVSRQIKSNEQQVERAMELMAEAKRQNRQDMKILQERQKERLEKSNTALSELLTRMQKLLAALKKMREGANIMVQDMSSEVDLKTRERAMLLAGYNAFNKARAIMAGSGDQREMFDMAMEYVTDDYANKMGEIDQFMDVSKSFLDSVDMDNGIAATKADASLDEWLNKSRIFGGPGHDAPVNGTDVHLRVPATNGATTSASSTEDEFADLIESNARPTRNERRQ